MPRTTAWRIAMKQALKHQQGSMLKAIAARCKPLILPLSIANCFLTFTLLKELETSNESYPEPKLNLMDRGTPTFGSLHTKVASGLRELFVVGKRRWYEGDVRATASWQGDQRNGIANPGTEKRGQ